MNFQQVQNQLTDLPRTFLRLGTPFTQWMDSITAGLTRYTSAADALIQQIVTFANAKFGWLDTWGLLFGIPRFANEADQNYSPRIPYIVQAGGGPPNAIAYWILNVWKVQVTVTENFPSVGYSITFPSGLTLAQIIQILISIARVRPAGVPITAVLQESSGLYLDTINFLDYAPSVTGAYLTQASSTPVSGLGSTTNNTQPLLPTLFLTDTTLNPNLV